MGQFRDRTRSLPRIAVEAFWIIAIGVATCHLCLAQRGVPVSRGTGFTLFGDVEVTQSGGAEVKPLTFDLLLYTRTGVLIDRQKVGSKGRYRFINVPQGDSDLVIELENAEVARAPVRLAGNPTDFRQDLALEWREASAPGSARPAVISADEIYDRKAPNKNRFELARAAFDKKDYDKAGSFLRELVIADPEDFPAWAELGTVYLAQKNLGEAERNLSSGNRAAAPLLPRALESRASTSDAEAL